MPGHRIAIVSHAHPSVNSGGAEISAYTLFQGFLEIGEDAIFVAACKESDLARLHFEWPDREYVLPFLETEHDWLYHLSPGKIQAELMRVLDEFDPDIINFHHFIFLGTQTLMAVAQRGRSSTYLTLHEFLALCQSDGQMVTRHNRRLCTQSTPQRCVLCWPEYDVFQFGTRRDHMQEMLRSMTGLISPSAFLRRRFADWGIDEARIAVIENGLARPPERRVANGATTGRPWVFGYFGQINPYKGVEVLLGAVEQHAASGDTSRERVIRIHGPLIGQSPEFVERLDRAVLSGLVEYAGPYPNEQVGDLMAACDYVVVPSLWWENSPVVIQEAFSSGRPVIVSGIGGMAEKVIDGHTGFHFAVGNATDLLRVMANAADAQTYERLCSHLPSAQTAAEAAGRYLAFFLENEKFMNEAV